MMKPASRIGLTRRGLLAGGAAMGMGGLMSFGPARADGTRKLGLQLGWLASNGILGEVCAEAQGYFEAAGIELEIVAGGPNIDGVASVASGRVASGQISSSPSLILARDQGIPVKCIAAGIQRHPYTYFSLARAPIRTPQDMVGKTIGIQATGRPLLDALLMTNHIDPDSVTVRVIGSDMTPLMSGQVDAISGWTTNVGALSVLGDQRVDLSLRDAGVQLYANCYYVTDETLARDADAVVAAMGAISRGWGWARENREEAVRLLVARYPNLSLEGESVAVPMVLDYAFDATTASGGWGTMNLENWGRQIALYAALGQFKGPAPAAEEVATLEILNATAAARPRLG